MFNLHEYVDNAIRTESRIDKVQCNRQLLEATVNAIISLGEILDQIKKGVFYNKPYKTDQLIDHANNTLIQWKQMIEVLSNPQWEHINEPISINPRIFHGIVGMVTESVEMLKALDFTLNKYDTVNILEELGDHDWYHAITVDQIATDQQKNPGDIWEAELNTNIDKLRARYPNKFTSKDAINRDLDKEREILNALE